MTLRKLTPVTPPFGGADGASTPAGVRAAHVAAVDVSSKVGAPPARISASTGAAAAVEGAHRRLRRISHRSRRCGERRVGGPRSRLRGQPVSPPTRLERASADQPAVSSRPPRSDDSTATTPPHLRRRAPRLGPVGTTLSGAGNCHPGLRGARSLETVWQVSARPLVYEVLRGRQQRPLQSAAAPMSDSGLSAVTVVASAKPRSWSTNAMAAVAAS